MGFSVSGATAVVFIGLVVSAATLYPAVSRSDELRRQAIDDRNERLLDRQNTAVELVQAVYNASNDTLVVRVNNTGASVLTVGDADLLVDGVYAKNATTEVDGVAGRTSWAPGERLEFRYDTATTPSRVKVVTGTGVAVTGEVT